MQHSWVCEQAVVVSQMDPSLNPGSDLLAGCPEQITQPCRVSISESVEWGEYYLSPRIPIGIKHRNTSRMLTTVASTF